MSTVFDQALELVKDMKRGQLVLKEFVVKGKMCECGCTHTADYDTCADCGRELPRDLQDVRFSMVTEAVDPRRQHTNPQERVKRPM